MATAPVFRASRGLNNVIEPHRLGYSEDGACYFVEAVNVIVDDGGSFKRRFGKKEVILGDPKKKIKIFGSVDDMFAGVS